MTNNDGPNTVTNVPLNSTTVTYSPLTSSVDGSLDESTIFNWMWVQYALDPNCVPGNANCGNAFLTDGSTDSEPYGMAFCLGYGELTQNQLDATIKTVIGELPDLTRTLPPPAERPAPSPNRRPGPCSSSVSRDLGLRATERRAPAARQSQPPTVRDTRRNRGSRSPRASSPGMMPRNGRRNGKRKQKRRPAAPLSNSTVADRGSGGAKAGQATMHLNPFRHWSFTGRYGKGLLNLPGASRALPPLESQADLLRRIAEALERAVPAARRSLISRRQRPSSGAPIAARWRQSRASTASTFASARDRSSARPSGREHPALRPRPARQQRALWGARGMGKSFLVKAAHAAINREKDIAGRLSWSKSIARTSRACRR